MKMYFLGPKKTLVKLLLDKDQEIVDLKTKIAHLQFKEDNYSTISKYLDRYITSDILVKETVVVTTAIDIKKQPLDFLWCKMNNKLLHSEPELKFICKDLKTELDFELSLSEVESLYEEYNT